MYFTAVRTSTARLETDKSGQLPEYGKSPCVAARVELDSIWSYSAEESGDVAAADHRAAPAAALDGRGEGADRRGELRGRRQYFRGRRRNGVVRGLLTVWRQKLAAAGVSAPGFVPVRISPESSAVAAGEPGGIAMAQARPQEMAAPPRLLCGTIEIEVSGGPHPGRAGGRSDDAFDGAVGAADDRAAGRSQGRVGGTAG